MGDLTGCAPRGARLGLAGVGAAAAWRGAWEGRAVGTAVLGVVTVCVAWVAAAVLVAGMGGAACAVSDWRVCCVAISEAGVGGVACGWPGGGACRVAVVEAGVGGVSAWGDWAARGMSVALALVGAAPWEA